MKRTRVILAALLLVGLGGAALAQTSAWETLWRTETAAERVSVAGRAQTRALIGREERSAIATVHAFGGRVRLDYEAGPRRWSLIDDGSNLIRLDPARQEAGSMPRPPMAVDPALAERNYVATVVREETIAGRPTQLIEVVPRSGGPAARRLWVDRETGFALKRELYNVDGRLMMGTEYVEVTFGAPVDPQLFQVPTGWRRVGPVQDARPVDLTGLARHLGAPAQPPRYLPPGYILLGTYLQRFGRRDSLMAEFRYTDGIRVLSVFQRPRGAEEPTPPGDGHRGGDRPGRGRGHGRGSEPGRGPEAGGGPHGSGFGFGPPGAEPMTLVDRGSTKALRYFGRERVVVVVGDLTSDEMVRVAMGAE